MEYENLLQIRNEIIKTPAGGLLFQFMHDYITQEACKNINADELKGMCRLVQELKSIPNKLQNARVSKG